MENIVNLLTKTEKFLGIGITNNDRNLLELRCFYDGCLVDG